MIAHYFIPISASSSSVHQGLEGVYSIQKRKEKSAGKMFRTAIIRYLASKSGGLLE
jgi:hypothetical protein